MPMRLPPLLDRFAADRRAVSAVEFALCLPFMVMLYLGGTQVSQAVSADRKVTLLARTVGDLVAQQSEVSSSSGDANAVFIGSIFDAASAIMYPFPLSHSGTTAVTITVSEIATKTVNNALVSNIEWTCTASSNLDSPTCTKPGTQVTVPAAEDATATVKAVATYTWTPSIAQNIVGPLSLTQTIYLRPRISPKVTLCPCS